MHISLNAQPLAVDFSHLRNLEEVLEALNEQFIPPGQQLYQVRVNGEFFSERYPRESKYIHLKDIATLEVTTLSEAEMARLILTEAAGQAAVLCLALEQSARLFRVAAEDEANHYYAQVLEALRWLLLTGEYACRVLQVDLREVLSLRNGQGSHYLKTMQALLEEMQEIHENTDYVLLADLMEYELLPLVREWREILENLARR